MWTSQYSPSLRLSHVSPLSVAAIDAALLDADVHRPHNLGVWSHRAHVGNVRWDGGKGPPLVTGNASDRLARRPVGPSVVTPVQQRRRDPQIESPIHARLGGEAHMPSANWGHVRQLPSCPSSHRSPGAPSRVCANSPSSGAREEGHRRRSLLVSYAPVRVQPKHPAIRADQEVETMAPLVPAFHPASSVERPHREGATGDWADRKRDA